MKPIWCGWVILLLACACSPADRCNWPPNNAPTQHILFIGNSYTFVNDLPGTFGRLACSGGHKVETAMSAEGGWKLADHAASSKTLDLIKQQKWDWVILQEQSEIPAVNDWRLQYMYPAARQLVAKIKDNGSKPMFLLTWGHRDGLPENGMSTYHDMQTQLAIGYTSMALELRVPISPVGTAWEKNLSKPDPLSLWMDDGSHPNEGGTYLAAAVLYASIFGQSPDSLLYYGGVSQASAHRLQGLAADTVLKK
jgi:hypothetical protein